MKRLVVTADDFGLSLEVNEAVEQAHREGILTAASLMVSAPAAADAVARAKRLPSLRVGLHLVLVEVVDERLLVPFLFGVVATQRVVTLLDLVHDAREMLQAVRARIALHRVHVAEQRGDGVHVGAIVLANDVLVLVNETLRALHELMELLFAHRENFADHLQAALLLARFGSFAEVIAAPRAQLREITGMTDGAVAQLKIVEAAALRLAQSGVIGRPALSSWSALLDYCMAAMAREPA